VTEAWQTNAQGPCVTVEGPTGAVEVFVLGSQRYRVASPTEEQEVEGYERACEVAHEMAGREDIDTDR
jgi:hypothetical protein